MSRLDLSPRLGAPDAFLAALMESLRDLDEAQARAFTARLILLLANQVGDAEALKVHVHTVFTGALKLQFGNLPNYDWMVRCHHDNIFQKIVNLTRAANPKWFVMDSLYACQGNGPFSPYSEDLIKDWNTICGGPDPVAVDTVCEALMDWDYPGTNAPATVLGAAEGLGTNRLDEIEIAGVPLNQVKRRFKRSSTVLQGQYPNVNIVMGSDCDAGCKAIVRIQFDQLQADGTLETLKRPLYVFAGEQFENFQPVVKPSDGDVIE